MERTLKRLAVAIVLFASLIVNSPGASAGCADKPAPNVDWRDCDLGTADLDGADLSGANLAGADLRNATITNVNFTGAAMNGTLFAPDADVSGSIFLVLPEGVADTATAGQDHSVDIAVLDNDVSENTGPSAILLIGAIDGPTYGTAEVVGGQVRYTPNPGYHGPDSFTYVPLADLDLDNLPQNVVKPVPGIAATVSITVLPIDPDLDPDPDPAPDPKPDPEPDQPKSPLTGVYAESTGVDAQVARLYAAYFGRNPDAAGFAYWLGRVKSGDVTLRYVSAAFEDSAEFQDTYGSLDDAAFVSLVYNNVFFREPDAGGLAYWLDQLANGMTRGEMMLFFSDSSEYRDFTGTG